MLKGKNIVLGITGGIAAYKSLKLISLLKKEGANVDVIMTRNAQEFVTPLTVRTLSKNAVVTDMFAKTDNFNIAHISLADKADILLVAPATANIIGKVANGIADDMLSTTIMATKTKVIFAPAMNQNMYQNPIVQNNILRLKELGYYFVDPEEGMLACGINGIGKMANVNKIINKLKEMVEVEKWKK